MTPQAAKSYMDLLVSARRRNGKGGKDAEPDPVVKISARRKKPA